MRALVIGASGLTGSALMRALAKTGMDASGTYCQRPRQGLVPLDIRDGPAIDELIAEVRPRIIFLPAALARSERCEDDPKTAFEVNVEGPRHIAAAAARHCARLVFYSTDAIFGGEDGPYAEDDAPKPVSVYGRTKLAAEQGIRQATGDYLIIRTTGIFGWDRESKNFAMQVWEELRAGRALRVADDHWGNPTLADYLAETSVRLAREGHTGVFNVVGKELVPRSELAYRLAATLGLDRTRIVPVPFREVGRKAPLPLRAGLKTDKLESALGEKPMSLDEALGRFRARWNADVRTVSR